MKKITSVPVGILVLEAILGILIHGVAFAQIITSGQKAPVFSLKDAKGQSYDLSAMKDRPMIIFYFFDVGSRPSQEGLLSLNYLAKQHKEADLMVWAITLSPRKETAAFAAGAGLTFPVLYDDRGVSDRYQARIVLPTVCIVGPGLAVLDYFQGGGKTTEAMLVRLAERELQRRQTALAKAISSEVIKKDPENVKAAAVNGYAALKEENLKEAEEVFTRVARKGIEGEVLGKEGLAAVFARQQKTERALQLVKEVEQKAPERAYIQVIKGDVLLAQEKKKEAQAAYQEAVLKKEAEPYQEGTRFNQAGRMYAKAGQFDKARELYDQALSIDPFYIEGTTNKGLTYEKEGKWEKALESYRQGMALDKNDLFANALARKVQEMIDLLKDTDRKKRVDQLVKDLAARYRSEQAIKPKAEDPWTSSGMILSFVDFQEKGGLSERDGFSTVMMAQLADHLNASGRVRVVERVLIERLIEELNLGSSDLANPETALKLGKILAARLIGTGSLYYLPEGTLLSLRLIDTETSSIPQVTTKQVGSQASLEKELFQLNREILRTVITKYPLRGYIAKVEGDRIMINLGSRQGVVQGTKFDVLEEQIPVQYKGRSLQAAPKPIGQLEVTHVEPDLSLVRIVKEEKPVRADAKIQERIEEIIGR
jgi:tetratricopeptide (TPR) repeat protein/peroxiredoxin